MMFSGMSAENAWRRRSCGGGTGGGACCSARASASWAASFGRSSGSVRRNSAARGPSRMLARLPLAILEDLLRQLAVRVGRRAIRIVLKDRHALHGGFREPDGLPDAGGEHAVPEVLLE